MYAIVIIAIIITILSLLIYIRPLRAFRRPFLVIGCWRLLLAPFSSSLVPLLGSKLGQFWAHLGFILVLPGGLKLILASGGPSGPLGGVLGLPGGPSGVPRGPI